MSIPTLILWFAMIFIVAAGLGKLKSRIKNFFGYGISFLLLLPIWSVMADLSRVDTSVGMHQLLPLATVPYVSFFAISSVVFFAVFVITSKKQELGEPYKQFLKGKKL